MPTCSTYSNWSWNVLETGADSGYGRGGGGGDGGVSASQPKPIHYDDDDDDDDENRKGNSKKCIFSTFTATPYIIL